MKDKRNHCGVKNKNTFNNTLNSTPEEMFSLWTVRKYLKIIRDLKTPPHIQFPFQLKGEVVTAGKYAVLYFILMKNKRLQKERDLQRDLPPQDNEDRKMPNGTIT